MAWFYQIRDAKDQVVKTEGGFATEAEAIEAGKKKADGLKRSGALAGGGFGTVTAGKSQLYRCVIGGVEITYEVDNPPTKKEEEELFLKWVATGQRDENSRKELERRGIRRVS
jgi:hypothetical protein